MNTCYVFGALFCRAAYFIKKDGDLVIAADAGFDRLADLGIKPDIAVGDFDSAKAVPTGLEVIRHPVRKDDTDLMLAIKTCFLRGYKSFVIFGCLGGRLDQTLASVQSAVYIAKHGGNSVFVSENGECLTVLENSLLRFKESATGVISVFSYTERAVVTLKNLSYELSSHEITSAFPLGVSNEFINKRAVVSCESGTIVVVWNGTPDDIISENL